MKEYAITTVVTVAFVLGVLALAETASCEERPRINVVGPLGLYAGLAAGDYVSTRAGLSLPGVREGNPALQGPVAQVAGQVVFAGASTWLDTRLQSRRSRLKWPFRLVVVGIKGAVMHHNWKVYRDARRARS